MRDIKAILSEAEAALRPILEAAFNAGKEVGRQEAAEEFRAKFTAILNSPPESSAPPPERPARAAVLPRPTARKRAVPGTVKPMVFQLIRDAPNGLTTKDLRERTTFKSNSIRGTLYNLRVEGKIVQVNDRWFSERDAPSNTETESDPDPEKPILNGGSYDDTCLTLVG